MAELAQPSAILLEFRHAARDLCRRIHLDVPAAAILDPSVDASVRTDADVLAGDFDVAADAAIDDDRVAECAEPPAHGAVHLDRVAGKRGAAADARVARHADLAAGRARPAFDIAFDAHFAARGIQVAPHRTGHGHVAAAQEGAAIDPLADLDAAAGREGIAVDRLVQHHHVARGQARVADGRLGAVFRRGHADAAGRDQNQCRNRPVHDASPGD